MKTENQFAVCIFADKDTLLTPRKIYEVLPDESALRSDYIRIKDDEGEDYLYPKKNFVFISVPREAANTILQIA